MIWQKSTTVASLISLEQKKIRIFSFAKVLWEWLSRQRQQISREKPNCSEQAIWKQSWRKPRSFLPVSQWVWWLSHGTWIWRVKVFESQKSKLHSLNEELLTQHLLCGLVRGWIVGNCTAWGNPKFIVSHLLHPSSRSELLHFTDPFSPLASFKECPSLNFGECFSTSFPLLCDLPSLCPNQWSRIAFKSLSLKAHNSHSLSSSFYYPEPPGYSPAAKE